MDGGLAAVMSWRKSHPPHEGETQGACWGGFSFRQSTAVFCLSHGRQGVPSCKKGASVLGSREAF